MMMMMMVTPWGEILPEKLTVNQLVENSAPFMEFEVMGRFHFHKSMKPDRVNNVFCPVLVLTLSFFKFVLKFFFHLRLHVSSYFFLSSLRQNVSVNFLIPPGHVPSV
jgi:hypothetical protein